MLQFSAPTEDWIKTEVGTLNADASAGSNVTLTLINNDGLAETDFIAVGHQGSGLCELAQINNSVTAGISARVTTLKFNHKAGEPITRYSYNQRKFYGA